jgi:putative ABC transport system substrate-binding protein
LGVAAVGTFSARAQQAIPVIGFLSARSPVESAGLLAAFRRGLAENGTIEDQSVAIEYRWALGEYDHLPAMAAELVRRPVAILVTVGGEVAARAAMAATKTIPIVGIFADDPVASGLVASLNRPEGNTTGVFNFNPTLEPKRLGLLHELVPQAATIGVLINPNYPPASSQLKGVEEAARSIGMGTVALRASNDGAIETAFEIAIQQRIRVLAVTSDPFFNTRSEAGCAGDALCRAHRVSFSGIRRGRRPDELRRRSWRDVSPGRHLCRAGPQRCQTRRFADHAADQV